MAHAWKNPDIARSFLDRGRQNIPFGTEQIDMMIRIVSAALPTVRGFVDLGCGDGLLGHALLTNFPDAKGLFIDYSAPMLSRAKLRFGEHSVHEIVHADMAQPTWTEAGRNFSTPIDVIVSGFAIHHLPHDRKYLLYQEIYECLMPGGVFVNIEHVASVSPWGEKLSEELMVDSMYQRHKSQGGTKTWDELWANHAARPDKDDNILLSMDTQLAWLREIGFYDVDCFFKCFELAVFAGRKP